MLHAQIFIMKLFIPNIRLVNIIKDVFMYGRYSAGDNRSSYQLVKHCPYGGRKIRCFNVMPFIIILDNKRNNHYDINLDILDEVTKNLSIYVLGKKQNGYHKG